MISWVIFRPAAEADLRDAFDWYEERQPLLGVEFLQEVDSCVGNILLQPEMYPVAHNHVRQAPVRRFPFCVMYLRREDTIIVLAVFPAARDPKIWRGRV
jgi:plasmid stabilization system protein ParE